VIVAHVASLAMAEPADEPSTASATLDSFFRRLGQGQGSRIWGGRAAAAAPAVPASTHPAEHRQAPSRSLSGSTADHASAAEAAAAAAVSVRSPLRSPECSGAQQASARSVAATSAPWLSPPYDRSRSPQPRTAAAEQSSAAAAAARPAAASAGDSSKEESAPLSFREGKYDQLLSLDVVKLGDLRKLSWNGVPARYRPIVWKLLSGYMPTNRDRRETALQRKRREYEEAVAQYFQVADSARTAQEQALLRQILVDVPRTAPEAQLFQNDAVQRSMTRVLYVWAVRHPASGYVQGINDLLTPFYLVFLSEHIAGGIAADVTDLAAATLKEVEADAYWCLTKLLDNIQDHYTAMQPGLQRMVLRLEELIRRIDSDLHTHLTNEGLQFIQFSFRWMNCLLMRELPLAAIIRAWDTYLSEEGGGTGSESFHIYVCAALLCKFSPQLLQLDFSSLVMFLQDLPTKGWAESDVEPLLSQAYILSTLFENSSAHLHSNT
jgi:TBC1 domain family member 2